MLWSLEGFTLLSDFTCVSSLNHLGSVVFEFIVKSSSIV